jgi:hypothetical protein
MIKGKFPVHQFCDKRKKMELVDQAIKNARRFAKRTNNVEPLRASSRLGSFVDMIDKQTTNRRCGDDENHRLICLEDSILAHVDDEPARVVHGDYLFNDIVHTMNNYVQTDGTPYVLRLDQQKMIAYILSACLPMIYKEELEIHKDRLLRMLGAAQIHELLLILASRRVGKTTCIAAVCAALIICKPEFKTTIMANTRIASKRVMEAIVSFLNMNERGRALLADKEAVKNAEKMVVRDPIRRTAKSLELYAATTHVRFFFSFVLSLSFFSSL